MSSIIKQLVVAAPLERAWRVFTSNMGTWWPTEHHIGAAAFAEIVIEPRVDGRWYERGTDGKDVQWGKVLVWEPPTRLVLAWQLDGTWQYNAALITEVDVRFTSLGEKSTRVDFEHRYLDRFGDLVTKVGPAMDKGWGDILDLYVAATAD